MNVILYTTRLGDAKSRSRSRQDVKRRFSFNRIRRGTKRSRSNTLGAHVSFTPWQQGDEQTHSSHSRSRRLR